ncbi:MAG: hypothetical protein QME75_09280 [Deltaproteobacteria bacterium]|nr:hypothetical protein [Deltaproteobacteria bacterium]
MQREKFLSRHHLPNGLVMELWDLSRHTAGDRWQVTVEVRVSIPISRQNLPAAYQDRFDDIVAALGPQITFTKQEVRNFIGEKEVPALVRKIEAELFASISSYLGHPEFAPRFILKTFKDVQERQRWYPPE